MKNINFIIIILCGIVIGYSREINDKLDLKLFITKDHMIFGAKGGFLRAQSYINTSEGLVLYAKDTELQERNMGIYDSINGLYLTIDSNYYGLKQFNIGDTIISLSSIINHSISKRLFKREDYSEKPIKVLEYISFILIKMKERHNKCTDINKLQLIVNPNLSIQDRFIQQIDSIARIFNFKTTIIKADNKDANERILKMKEDWEGIKGFAQGCLDDRTEYFLDSALRKSKSR